MRGNAKANRSRDEILAQIDAKMNGLLPAMEAQQRTFAAQHNNRFWQGLRSHSVAPADGDEKRPDIGTRAPTDQTEPYPPVLRNANLPCAMQVDVYDGPSGIGYTATLTVVIEGQEWQRVANEGPETHRVRPWFAVPPRGFG